MTTEQTAETTCYHGYAKPHILLHPLVGRCPGPKVPQKSPRRQLIDRLLDLHTDLHVCPSGNGQGYEDFSGYLPDSEDGYEACPTYLALVELLEMEDDGR